MPYNFSAPDDFGEIHASELHTSLGESIGAQGSEAFMGGVRGLYRGVQYGAAENEGAETLGSQISRLQNGEDLSELVEHPQPTAVDVPIDDAKARVKQEGLEGQFKLPDQPTIRKPVLDLMLQHAHERAEYNAAVSRGPQGFFPGALGMVTEIGAGMIDPVNMAAFSIPVLGEARWGQMLASAGESLTKRAGVKALQGGLQGAVGSAALVPGDWWLHTKDGQDYTMADALKSVVMGAGMGATFHAGFGAFGDIRARARGVPLPGSPEDLVLRGLMHGTHVPAAALESEGLPAEEIPGIAPAAAESARASADLGADVVVNGQRVEPTIPPHPAEILADLPPAAREDAYRATAADVIAGRLPRTAEMLAEAAKEDPRIAESVGGVEAFHGSPYDFDRFDSSKIGTGEGAQAIAYGHYAAENDAVARSYELVNQPGHINRLAQLTAKEAYKVAEMSLRPGEDVMAATRETLQRSLDTEIDPRLKQRYADALNNLEELVGPNKVGNLYKVHIAPHADEFLDWETDLSAQPAGRKILAAMDPKFKEQLEGYLEEHDQPGLEDLTGGMFHRLLERYAGEDELPGIKQEFNPFPRKEASQYIESLGVPGVRFLDQKSRSPRAFGDLDAAPVGDKPTRNYVVFKDSDLRITHKNGQEVGLDEMKAEQGKAAAAEASNVVHVKARKASGPAARPEATRSLFEHIAANGGLRADDLAANGGLRADDPMIPDVKSSLGRDNHFVPGFGNLIRKPGQVSSAAARSGARAPMSLDAARESAVHAGYLEDQGAHTGGQSTSTVRHLLDAIDTEARGNRVYRNGAEPPRTARDQAQHEHELNNAMDKGLGDYGVDLDRIPSKTRARTLEIMDREGVTDPLDAYERAVMEETEHGAQAGEHERIPETIPGWDVADDAGAAPGAGGAAEAGGEPGAGGPARDAGQGDRAAGRPGAASAGGVKADFRKFADGRRAVDDPDDVAASKAAEATPEPQSVEPTKAVSAAEAAAKEADQLVADILPTLSDKERKIFEDALRELKDDKEARDQVVRDGAACLAAAVA